MLKTWRLEDVLVAFEAGGVDDEGWGRLVTELDRAVADAADMPFLRILVVIRSDAALVRWSDQPMVGLPVPLAVVGDAPDASALVDVIARAGFNARAFSMESALDALKWLAIDGARARAILREMMAAGMGEAVDGSVVAALKERAATPGTLAVDAERFRIARDLHDGVCASLAGLRMRLGVLSTMSADPHVQAELDALGDGLEGVLDDVRTIAWAMRVGEPTWQQLIVYLEQRVREVTGARVETSLEVNGVDNHVSREVVLRLVDTFRVWAARIVRSAGNVQLALGLRATPDGIAIRLADPQDEHTLFQQVPS